MVYSTATNSPNESPPPQRHFEILASVKTGGSGFSNVSTNNQMEELKVVARQKGGDALIIRSAFPPDFRCAIWRFNVDIIAFTGSTPFYPDSAYFGEQVMLLRNAPPCTLKSATRDLAGIWRATVHSPSLNSGNPETIEFALLSGNDIPGGANGMAYTGYATEPSKFGNTRIDRGELRITLEKTASSDAYILSWFTYGLRKLSQTVVLQHPAVLSMSTIDAWDNRGGIFVLDLIRMTPEISSSTTSDDPSTEISSGTGVFLTEDGLLVTAAHVIEDKENFSISTAFGVIDNSEVSIIKIDIPNDLVLLRANSPELESKLADIEFPPLRSSLGMRIGEPVFLLGHPLTRILGEGLRFSSGEISATFGVQSDPRMLQFSAAAHPGNSGGPLFDSSGAIVGIVVSTLSPLATWRASGSLPQNINFAIKSDILKQLTKQAGYNVPLVAPSNSDFVSAPPSVIESAKKLVLRVIAE